MNNMASSIRTNKSASENATIQNEFEVEGLKTIKQYIEDYLEVEKFKDDSCHKVRIYLEKVKEDEELLMKYLRGRKNNPFIAWDTLRRYTENKFQLYPEIFPDDCIPEKVRDLVKGYVVGVMKHRDRFGRRIGFIDMTKWDANIFTLDDLTTAAVVGCEKFWKEPDVIDNGIILIENTKGFGMAHARQHTMNKLIRMRNIFLFSFPAAIKGIYYLNMPSIFRLVFKMSKPLFPKKIRSRMFLYSSNEIPSELFEIVSPETLPTWAGGNISIQEAAEDITFYEEKMN